MSEGKLHIGAEECWERILQRLRQGESEDETPVEKKVFTAKLERTEIAIYLGAEKIHWRNVSKEQFNNYFGWYEYCSRRGFNMASRQEMKKNIRDVAQSSSYTFALISRCCTSK